MKKGNASDTVDVAWPPVPQSFRLWMVSVPSRVSWGDSLLDSRCNKWRRVTTPYMFSLSLCVPVRLPRSSYGGGRGIAMRLSLKPTRSAWSAICSQSRQYPISVCFVRCRLKNKYYTQAHVGHQPSLKIVLSEGAYIAQYFSSRRANMPGMFHIRLEGVAEGICVVQSKRCHCAGSIVELL